MSEDNAPDVVWVEERTILVKHRTGMREPVSISRPHPGKMRTEHEYQRKLTADESQQFIEDRLLEVDVDNQAPEWNGYAWVCAGHYTAAELRAVADRIEHVKAARSCENVPAG